MASTDARLFPTKNTAFRCTFPIFDADGDLVTGATGLDSEVSKDGGTFADCTNEATEIATNSGMYYLELTSTEMNADTVAIIVKTSTVGAKTTPLVFYPVTTTVVQLGVNAVAGATAAELDKVPKSDSTVTWNATALASIQSECNDALTATVADSVPTDGTRPSIAQAVLMITRMLMEKSVSGTTVTVKKEDGTTSSMTFTLNDGTSPTSITRAS